MSIRVLLWAVVMVAELFLSDGTTLIDLRDKHGFQVYRWEPMPQELRDVWHDPGAGLRRVAVKARGTAREEMEIDCTAGTPAKVSRLQQMLEQARAYWVGDPTADPVWIGQRKPCGTMRYAHVRGGDLDTLPAWHTSPYEDRGQATALRLSLERGPWSDQKPGDGGCVESDSFQAFPSTETDVTYPVNDSSDDAWGYPENGACALATTDLYMGYFTAGPTLTRVRFNGVDIPVGSTIVNAYIEFTASNDQNNEDCNLLIKVEDSADPTTLTSGVSQCGSEMREKELWDGAIVYWSKIEKWVDTTRYDTPDLSVLLQYVIDKEDWAAGNAVAFQLMDDGSTAAAVRQAASFDHATYDAPVLYITYKSIDLEPGIENTCEDSAYIANKHVKAQITHAYRYDASLAAFSGNLIGGALPYALFPTVPATGDILYLGSSTGFVNAGPFSSAIFDILVPAVFAGDAIIEWEYWNGAAWTTLTVTNGTATALWPVDSFSRVGVGSVHWEQPSNWATRALNGVTAWWVRAELVVTAGSMVQPTQQNRDVYSVCWPCLILEELEGEMDAAGRVLIHNRSAQEGALENPTLYATRVLMGTRSISRGADFSAYLNFSRYQNPDGVQGRKANSTTFVADPTTPTGYRATYAPAAISTTFDTQTYLEWTPEAGQQWYGIYRAFLRGRQVGGVVGDIGIRCQLFADTGGGTPRLTLWTSEELEFASTNDDQVVDLGRIVIPGASIEVDEQAELRFDVQCTCANASVDAYFYDLILLPVDEWAADVVDTEEGGTSIEGQLGREASTFEDRYLDVDGLNPRLQPRAIIKTVSEDLVRWPWQARCSDVRFKANHPQKLWFFMTKLAGGSTDQRAPHEIASSVQVDAALRYLS